jgi:PA26 p53-induced protein (sestrin)
VQVNALVPIPTKTFLKKVACFPELLTSVDFSCFSSTFTVDERVHIVMLVCEARRQAGLLYALRAVMRHMTGGS